MWTELSCDLTKLSVAIYLDKQQLIARIVRLYNECLAYRIERTDPFPGVRSQQAVQYCQYQCGENSIVIKQNDLDIVVLDPVNLEYDAIRSEQFLRCCRLG